MSFYKNLLRPLLFKMDPERAHHLAMFALRALSQQPDFLRHDVESGLERTFFGLKFPNPIGLAAGFDKNALALPAWGALGFGFVEAGTITAHPQPGNPKPRLFRFPREGALINRMGFNNDGADVVAERLRKLRVSGRWPGIPIGINIGKSKITPIEEATGDYLHSFEKLYPHADYLVLNVSSPNTPGLRTLQNKAALEELLAAVQKKNAELSSSRPSLKPVLIKIAPDLEFEQVEEILNLATTFKLSGIVATNTTIDHGAIPEALRTNGGLSGRPLRKRSTEIVRFISSKSSVPIIAAGGIEDVESAQEKFDSGASLVQLYTGFIYEGPALLSRLRKVRLRN